MDERKSCAEIGFHRTDDKRQIYHDPEGGQWTLEDQDPYLELKQPFKWRESKAAQMPR